MGLARHQQIGKFFVMRRWHMDKLCGYARVCVCACVCVCHCVPVQDAYPKGQMTCDMCACMYTR